jgi:dCTP deaminase
VILNDGEIRARIERGDILIDPVPEDQCFQPASVDLTLGDTLRIYSSVELAPDIEPDTFQKEIDPEEGYKLSPGEFCLGVTRERVVVPPDLVARVEGKSSIGRMGLLVHVTAGFIDPGFDGRITLELCNLNPGCLIVVKPGMRISQLAFEAMTAPAERPYGANGLGSRYKGDMDAEAYRVVATAGERR